MKSISAADFLAKWQVDPDIQVLDVRTPVEWAEVSLRGAVLQVSLNDLEMGRADLAAKVKDKIRPLYVICRTDNRSRMACEHLTQAGLAPVYVEGGMQSLERLGADVVRGEVVSIERQVRIAAGSLVLLGTLLGAIVAPAFYLLSAFVGAGLVFAGVTNTCGMGLLLARAPWNKRSS